MSDQLITFRTALVPTVSSSTLNTFDSLAVSDNAEVVEVYKKLVNTSVDVDEAYELVNGDQSLLPKAYGTIALSQVLDTDPKRILDQAQSLIEESPSISRNTLAQKLLSYVALTNKGIVAELAKEMIEEGWGKENDI